MNNHQQGPILVSPATILSNSPLSILTNQQINFGPNLQHSGPKEHFGPLRHNFRPLHQILGQGLNFGPSYPSLGQIGQNTNFGPNQQHAGLKELFGPNHQNYGLNEPIGQDPLAINSASPPISPSTTSASSSPISPLENISPKQFIDNLILRAMLNQLNELMAAENALEAAKRAEKAAIQEAMAKERQQRHPLDLGQKKSSVVNASHQQISPSNEEQEMEKEEPYLTRCGITWKFLKTVKSEREFDELRRAHQVSKNRHVGYGIRYACTRNAKARDNCPYLMLCMQSSNGKLKVFYRNSHTHPIRHIRTRD